MYVCVCVCVECSNYRKISGRGGGIMARASAATKLFKLTPNSPKMNIFDG